MKLLSGPEDPVPSAGPAAGLDRDQQNGYTVMQLGDSVFQVENCRNLLDALSYM